MGPSVVFEAVSLCTVVLLAVLGVLLWDRRYRGAKGPADQLQPTEETFRDPTTGRMVRVFFNSVTGERQYRETRDP